MHDGRIARRKREKQTLEIMDMMMERKKNGFTERVKEGEGAEHVMKRGQVRKERTGCGEAA